MKARLIISIPFESQDEDALIALGKEKLNLILANAGSAIPDDSQFSLVRDGDRSGKNLLLPKLGGRTGEHFDSRKATKKDLGK